jgi:hypothetical protein
MLYREIIAVCSEINIKHINTVCGQNVVLLNGGTSTGIVTTGLDKFNINTGTHSEDIFPHNTNNRIFNSFPNKPPGSHERTTGVGC